MTNSPKQDLHKENPQAEEAPIEAIPNQKGFSFDIRTIRNRQRYLLWGIGSCLIGTMVIYGGVTMGERSYGRKQEFKNSITTGSSRVNPQNAWMYQFRNESELTKKRLDAMDEALKKILKINETSKANASKAAALEKQMTHGTSRQSTNDSAKVIEEVRQDIKQAQTSELSRTPNQQLTQSPNSSQNDTPHSEPIILPPPPGETSSSDGPTATTQQNRKGSSTFPGAPVRSKAVRKISLSLKNARSHIPLKSVDNTIPAGAFAKAILLGGVDASASISASSDPRPALLRVMDLGTLPRKFHSDLVGCHALAACYGDISSERVYMRLEKLTCVERKTGEIIETKVQGYVAGEDGRTGVRGSVVDRAGESMRNVLMGGFLGGVGEFLSQSRNSAITFSPVAGLAQSNPIGMGEMLKAGAGKGINNALEKYEDFYIKRAEQLQPVIQVAAGRQVDIVFTEGVSLNETLYRQALGRSNDQSRYSQIHSLNEDARTNVSDWIPNAEPRNSESIVK
jgi:conjugal transfer pilus assembly protein TraB